MDFFNGIYGGFFQGYFFPGTNISKLGKVFFNIFLNTHRLIIVRIFSWVPQDEEFIGIFFKIFQIS